MGGMDWFDLAQYMDKWRTLRECDNDLPGYIKCGKSLHWLRTC